MQLVHLSIGSNLGDRKKNIISAVSLINERIGEIIKISSVYMTEPWGFESEKYFLNLVVIVKTTLSPDELLFECQQIETMLLRKKSLKNEYKSRSIDIDILFYNDIIINKKDLIIPHPLIHKRKFVLLPLLELNQDFKHPVLKSSIKELFEKCDDAGKIRKLKLKLYE